MSNNPYLEHARVLAAALVGTIVEYYDWYLYGFAAALVFGPLFFASSPPPLQTLFAMMSFGLAFFARPVGAIAFGHFGDRIGRKSTLVVSMLIMGSCTVLIAFLPTHAMVSHYGPGWIAPALLCLLRLGQGFGLGGEWAGAALLSIEYAPAGWRARFGAMPSIGSAIGNLLATGIFLVMGVTLSEAEFLAWGWRLPFLASAVLVLVGLWVRLKIAETPEFQAAVKRKAPVRVPIARLFAQHKRVMLAHCAAVVAPFALVYFSTTLALAEATTRLGYERDTILLMQLIAMVVPIPTAILGSRYADRTSPARMMFAGGVGTIIVGFVFSAGLESGSLALVGATLCATTFVWGLICSSTSIWSSDLYPVHVRYSGFAFSFNVGGAIGGAVLPNIALIMGAAGTLSYVGLLLSIAGVLLLFAMVLGRPHDVRSDVPAMARLYSSQKPEPGRSGKSAPCLADRRSNLVTTRIPTP